MKKVICVLLMASLLIGLCACVGQEHTESEVTSAGGESVSVAESSEGSAVSGEETKDPSGDTASVDSEESTPSEGSDASENGVLYDENGNVILSDPPTYAEVLALHEQDPEHYRDPGELQPETHEMIRLENGQWYQSYVWASFNCRCIFIHGEERGREDWDYWTFIDIGSAENAFLFNIGVMYDDAKGDAMYSERPIAVRGTLSEAPDGYAYMLQLPDELIVCVENDDGHAGLLNTETLAIPESYASLFEGKTGEVIVTGVVMKDKNDVFYLKNVELYP